MTKETPRDIINELIQQRPNLLYEAREKNFSNTIFIIRGIVPHFIKKYDNLLENRAKRYLAIEHTDVFTLSETERQKRYKEMNYLYEEIQTMNSMRTVIEDINEQWENRYYNMVEYFRKVLTDAHREHVECLKNQIILSKMHDRDQDTIRLYTDIILSRCK